MRVKEIIHRIKLIVTLFTKARYRYRVEVEDYYPETWDSTVLNYYHFNDFSDAQKFIERYSKPFYIIRLFEQEKFGFTLCNINTEQLATLEDEKGIDYHIDKYGYTVPVPLSAGWYKRGWHTHHPVWVSVRDDLTFMLTEATYRFMGKGNTSVAISLDSVVHTLFEERHADAPAHFRRNFKKLLLSTIHETVANLGEK